MTSRDQFEQAYAEHTTHPVEFIALCRLGESYSVPKVSSAWLWWQASRAAAVVNMPIDVTGGLYRLALEDCTMCIKAAGLKVAS